jgi:hypothetical protein
VSRRAAARSRARSGARAGRREPDHALVRRRDVAYRFVLGLRDARGAAALLDLLSEAAIPLRYLLLLPSDSAVPHTAYVGLGSTAVADLPIRLASRGIRVERGEECGPGPGPMRSRIGRCDLAPNGATPIPPGAQLPSRRKP